MGLFGLPTEVIVILTSIFITAVALYMFAKKMSKDRSTYEAIHRIALRFAYGIPTAIYIIWLVKLVSKALNTVGGFMSPSAAIFLFGLAGLLACALIGVMVYIVVYLLGFLYFSIRAVQRRGS